MSEGILNPPRSSEACLRMMECVEKRIEKDEKTLTTTVVDRELYLQLMGRVAIAREILREQKHIYATEFDT